MKTLAYHYDKMTFSVFTAFYHVAYHLFFIKGNLGYCDGRGTGGNSCVKRDLARVSAHYLNNITSCVALAGVAQAVHHCKNGVHSGIKAYCVVSAYNIIVYGSRYSNAGYTVCGERGSTSECTVAAYGDNAVNSVILAGLNSLCHALGSLEFKASVAVKDSTAVVDDVGNVARRQRLYIALYKTAVATVDSYYLKPLVYRRANDRSYHRVHSGSIST